MNTIDIGSYFVVYNFVIGVLMMASSEKLGQCAGWVNRSRQETIARYARVSVFTFGATVAGFMAVVYIAFYTLKIGV